MLLVLLDAILLQAGNVASPALLNPFGIQPIIRIQEVQSFKIQDVSAALRSWQGFDKTVTQEWKAGEPCFWEQSN